MRSADGRSPASRRSNDRWRSRAAVLAAAVLAAVFSAGCGAGSSADEEELGGGRVSGGTLTVVSLLPLAGDERTAARQIVRGQKLALAEAGGRAGSFRVTFSSLDEGSREDDSRRQDAADATRAALADSQAIAVVGPLHFESAAVSVPLLNAAGMLHVSPTVGYAGFTAPLHDNEPEFWYPAGRRTFVPLGGTDTEQARVVVDATIEATGTPSPRIAIEPGSGREDEAFEAALEDAVRSSAAVPAGSRAGADAVVYAGDDPEDARRLAQAVGGSPDAALVVFGDDIARTDLARRLGDDGAARPLFVSRAPRPGSSPDIRRFERLFESHYGRAPGPYAYLGYEAMRSVLRDGIRRAGDEANVRAEVIEAYMRGPLPESEWSAFRLRDGRPEYLRLDSAS